MVHKLVDLKTVPRKIRKTWVGIKVTQANEFFLKIKAHYPN
jgi:hypothetical protein